MNRLFLKLATTLLVSSVLYSTPGAAQESPTTKKAAIVQITQGPEIERADPDFAIIRWTSNNPGGSLSITESCITVLFPRNLARQQNLRSG